MRYHNPSLAKTLVFFFIFPFSFVLISCSDTSTEPPPKPPGYQEDIPWPSLADSPWPMYRHDPQNTGRTNYPGPVYGEIDFITDSIGVRSGAAVSEDSTIYFVANFVVADTGITSGLVALKPDGRLKWIFSMDVKDESAHPVIANDGTIYTTNTYGQNYLYAINSDGSLKWKIGDLNLRQTTLNIGKGGTIYVIEDLVNLLAVTPVGEIKWKMSGLDIYGSEVRNTAISPDGNTIYIPGKWGGKSVVAVDLTSQTEKWSFGGPHWGDAPIVVDSQGHIYIINFDEQNNVDLYSLEEDGSIRWKFNLEKNYNGILGYQSIAMDINGNIYTGHDTLFAINYLGNLEWKKGFDGGGYLSSPMAIDIDNYIYFDRITSTQEILLSSIGTTGNEIWQLSFPYFTRTSFSLGISYSQRLLFPTWRSQYFSIIK